ncbi:MAG: response regulator [Bacteroidales bacterium]
MKPLIMLVDDRPEIAKVISMYLKGSYDTVYFDNVIGAMAYLQKGNLPDLIITDINMPEISGFEFLSQLKSSVLFSHVPVFVLSSIESRVDQIKLLEIGAADFILKPFNPEELKVRIAKWIKS